MVLSGYYGFGNLGDEALLSGLVDGLRQRGLEPVVLSADPSATRKALAVPAYHRYGGLPAALLGSQALVSGGGGLLQDKTSARSLRYYLGVIRLARVLGKRVVVYGQSVGPLSSEGRESVARALRGAHVALRDAASVALAEELGLSAELVGDPALLLGVPPFTPPPDVDRPVLLIPRAGHEGLNDALTEAGRRLLAEGIPIAVLALHPSEDGPAASRLQHETGGQRLQAATVPDAMHSIASARYVLSVRLHGLILACAAGVGFAGLVYDPKVEGFSREVGAPAFRAPVDVDALVTLARMAEPTDRALRDRSLRLASEGLDWLAAALGSSRATFAARRKS